MEAVLLELRTTLEQARQHGIVFSDAWPQAYRSALALARPGPDRETWSAALEGTRHTWSACYCGAPAGTLEVLVGSVGEDA